ncbi:MAG: hypothetical protein P8R31_19565 [Mariniblastus sp.]|nr:hypothetical protein [Mariniblastus sp.]
MRLLAMSTLRIRNPQKRCYLTAVTAKVFSHQAFSDAFVLKSKTEKEVREFFDQQLLDEFATSPDLCIESSTNTFIYFRHWKRVEADATAIQDFLSVGLQRVGEIRSRLNRGPAVGQIDPNFSISDDEATAKSEELSRLFQPTPEFK